MSDDASWFYEFRGERVGPVSVQALSQKRREGVISDTTLVWHPEFGAEWRPLKSTSPASAPPKGIYPPAMPSPSVGNSAAWALALWPVIYSLILGILFNFKPVESAWFNFACTMIGYIGFAVLDRRCILKAGSVGAPSAWWGILPPIYLSLRSTIVGRSYFLLLFGTFCFLVAVLLGILPDKF